MMVANRFVNYISLGWFCGVAIQLKQYGLRKFSSPFDWILCDYSSVISNIESKFDSFMEFAELRQSEKDISHYKDTKNGFEFFHDFNWWERLEKQYSKVKGKYLRRISRFLEKITEPTLFVRYVKDVDECDFILSNKSRIESILKGPNKYNDVIYISDDKYIVDALMAEKNVCFFVHKDKNDVVCRLPIDANQSLRAFLNGVRNDWTPKRHNPFFRIATSLPKKLFGYRHDKRYTE